MPLYLDGPVIQRGLALEQFETPFRTYMKAKFDEALDNNITPLLIEDYKVRTAGQGALEGDPGAAEFGMEPRRAPAQRMPAEVARAKVKDANLNLNIPDDGIPEAALDILMARKHRQRAYEDAINRSPTGLRSVAGIGASLAASVLDPLNLASAFVPVVGEARYSMMLARASGAMGRAGVRAGVGAIEGTVGMAMLEPAAYAAHAGLQDDYTALDSIINIGFGGALGGGLHVAGGAFRDVLGGPRRWATAEVRADQPITESVTIKQAPAEEMVTLYHGSPHEFERFDMSKIGTGEGAQAYGHGLYFAESQGVAKTYAGMSKRHAVEPDTAHIAAARDFIRNGMEPGAGLKSAYPDILPQQAEAAIIEARGGFSPNIYRVEIPRSTFDRMLDWDKPLKDQPQVVKDLANKLFAPQLKTREIGSDLVDVYLYQNGGGSLGVYPRAKVSEVLANPADHMPLTGAAFYESSKLVPGDVRDKVAATEALKAAGIPGIRYLDQGSRDGAKGTRNVVLFDESHIRSAQNLVKNATPQQRESALRTAIAQATDGRAVNVAPLLDPNASMADAVRKQGSPDSEALADPAVSRGADERIAAAPKSLDLKTAEDEFNRAMAAVDELWQATGRNPDELKGLLPGLDEMTNQADSLARAARAAALCDV